jgi:hypothetical protein
MPSTLTGKKIKNTYLGIIKTADNQQIGGSLSNLTDGNGNSLPISISNAQVDINGSLTASRVKGSNHILVTAKGTPQENATELQDAYDELKTMLPSADNRLTLIAAPGEYQFPSTFTMDTQYIDLVSLTGNRDVIFDLQGITDPFTYDDNTFDILGISECLLINTDNVYVKGIKGKFYLSPNLDEYWWFADGENEKYILPIQVGDNLPNIVVENCEGDFCSFGGDFTFGDNPITVNGTFINCIGDDLLFGAYGTVSGTFINCIGLLDSFRGTASGTFTNCQGGDYSFGTFGTASGTFTNCQGGELSFGSFGTASGTFRNCIGGSQSFAGFDGTASGTFINCTGGNTSFGGGSQATLTGKLYYCRLTSGTFKTVTSGGVTVLCIDGNNQINTQN